MKNFFLACRESRIEPSSPPLYYGSFYIGPFENGQALTIANALRRTLLSEIPGLGITALKMGGVFHEYSNLTGMRENVMDVLLNFKEIVLKKTTGKNLSGKQHQDLLTRTQVGYLQVRGPGTVRASDLQLPPTLECVDPDQYICTLNEQGSLNVVFTIEEGKNFLFRKNKMDFSNLRKIPAFPGQFLPIDPVFSPIKRVNYSIQNYSSETVYKCNQFVILEISTNGSISPKEALSQSLNFLRFVFSELGKLEVLNSLSNSFLISENPNMRQAFRDLDRDLDFFEYSLYKKKMLVANSKLKPVAQDSLRQQRFLETSRPFLSEETYLTELGLPFPTFKALYRAKILKVKDLLKFTKTELEKTLNLNKPAFDDLLQKINQKNLTIL